MLYVAEKFKKKQTCKNQIIDRKNRVHILKMSEKLKMKTLNIMT